MNTPERNIRKDAQNRVPHPDGNRLNYYSRKYNIDSEQVRAALASVGNDERLLEGFLRKNVGLHGHR